MNFNDAASLALAMFWDKKNGDNGPQNNAKIFLIQQKNWENDRFLFIFFPFFKMKERGRSVKNTCFRASDRVRIFFVDATALYEL